VAVTTLVGPEGHAHVYQPTPADAAEVAKARIVFENGLGFEGWLARLIRSSGYKSEVVTFTKGVSTIAPRDAHAHAGGDRSAPDPHAWQDLANALGDVTNIKAGLCRVDGVRCAHYAYNAGVYQVEIAVLHAEIKSAIRAIAPERRKVITSHDAFGYFGHAYGVTVLAPQGLSTESEPSAKVVARLIDQIRRAKVKALLVESISDPRLVEQIAPETG
jgi:zinc/manganese transport system substrate-binding protein